MSETRIAMLEEQVKSLSDELLQCQVCVNMQSKQLAYFTKLCQVREVLSDDSKFDQPMFTAVHVSSLDRSAVRRTVH